jgi:hypothetical protein
VEREGGTLTFSSFSFHVIQPHDDKRREVHQTGYTGFKKKSGEEMVLLGPYSGCTPSSPFEKVEWKGR